MTASIALTVFLALVVPGVAAAQRKTSGPGGVSTAPQSGPFPGSVIRFDGGNVHDFGPVPQGPAVKCRFVYTNVGNQPVVVQSVTSATGAMTSNWSKALLLPGKTAVINVRYSTQGSVGPFQESLYISSNATDAGAPKGTAQTQGRIVLQVRGVITPATTGPRPGIGTMPKPY